MPDSLLDHALVNFTEIVKDRFAVVESAKDEAIAQASESVSERNKLREQLAELAATNASLVKELADLKAGGSGIPLWTTGTKLEPRKTYRLPDEGVELNVSVEVEGVTFIGGWAWPKAGFPAFNVRPGGVRFTVLGVRFHHPNPPPDKGNPLKYGLGACVETWAADTSVIGCDVGSVDGFVKPQPGAVRTLVARNVGGNDIRSHFFYSGGGRDAAIVFNTAVDSRTENLVRFMYDDRKGVRTLADGAVVAFNDFANPGNKSVINPRHVRNVVIFRNRLAPSPGHSCVGIGDQDPADGEPGVEDLRVIDNDCYEGMLNVHAGAKRILLERNRAHWTHAGAMGFITADAKPGTLEDLRILNNTGDTTVPQKYPLVTYNGDKARIKGLEERDNAWAV